jgi:hypothetical protein
MGGEESGNETGRRAKRLGVSCSILLVVEFVLSLFVDGNGELFWLREAQTTAFLPSMGGASLVTALAAAWLDWHRWFLVPVVLFFHLLLLAPVILPW